MKTINQCPGFRPHDPLAAVEHLARRCGVPVHRSDRSESRYFGSPSGGRTLRLSTHHLGYADYGTREQVHAGPELVGNFGGASDISEIVADMLHECRGSCLSDSWERRCRANLIRGLRRMLAHLDSPKYAAACKATANRRAGKVAKLTAMADAARAEQARRLAEMRERDAVLSLGRAAGAEGRLVRALAAYAREMWPEWAERQIAGGEAHNLAARAACELGVRVRRGVAI